MPPQTQEVEPNQPKAAEPRQPQYYPEAFHADQSARTAADKIRIVQRALEVRFGLYGRPDEGLETHYALLLGTPILEWDGGRHVVVRSASPDMVLSNSTTGSDPEFCMWILPRSISYIDAHSDHPLAHRRVSGFLLEFESPPPNVLQKTQPSTYYMWLLRADTHGGLTEENLHIRILRNPNTELAEIEDLGG